MKKHTANLRMVVLSTMMQVMAGENNPSRQAVDISKAEPREWHPWDTIQLTKAERKGKSFEQLQALRQERWVEARR